MEFGVDAFGGVDAAAGGVLDLRVVFEGVGVYHVGGFDVDVPCFFFEATAGFYEGADGVEEIEIALELLCVEPVREVLGEDA